MENTIQTISEETVGQWATQEQTEAKARRMAREYRCSAFVYQTAADRFNFCFGSENESIGVLIARFDCNGNSF